jgi:hypothetical protein
MISFKILQDNMHLGCALCPNAILYTELVFHLKYSNDKLCYVSQLSTFHSQELYTPVQKVNFSQWCLNKSLSKWDTEIKEHTQIQYLDGWITKTEMLYIHSSLFVKYFFVLSFYSIFRQVPIFNGFIKRLQCCKTQRRLSHRYSRLTFDDVAWFPLVSGCVNDTCCCFDLSLFVVLSSAYSVVKHNVNCHIDTVVVHLKMTNQITVLWTERWKNMFQSRNVFQKMILLLHYWPQPLFKKII